MKQFQSQSYFSVPCVVVLQMIHSGLVGSSTDFRSGRGATRAEDAHGTPTQNHISTHILVNEENAVGFYGTQGWGGLPVLKIRKKCCDSEGTMHPCDGVQNS